MGRSRRSGGQGALSLLSFQDIITSLSGIMILLVLLLALDISPEQPPPPSKPLNEDDAIKAALPIIGKRFDGLDPDNPYDMAEIKNGLGKIQTKQIKDKDQLIIYIEGLDKKIKRDNEDKEKQDKKIQALTEKLAKLKKQDVDNGDGIGGIYTPKNKSSLLAECSGTAIRAGFWDSTEPPKTYSTDSSGQNEFISALNNLKKDKEYIVFFIKPSAADYAMELINKVRNRKYDVGYDPMIEKNYVGNFGKPEGS